MKKIVQKKQFFLNGKPLSPPLLMALPLKLFLAASLWDYINKGYLAFIVSPIKTLFTLSYIKYALDPNPKDMFDVFNSLY